MQIHRTLLQSQLQRGFHKVNKEGTFRNKYLYIMAIPVVLYYIVFHYSPLWSVDCIQKF